MFCDKMIISCLKKLGLWGVFIFIFLDLLPVNASMVSHPEPSLRNRVPYRPLPITSPEKRSAAKLDIKIGLYVNSPEFRVKKSLEKATFGFHIEGVALKGRFYASNDPFAGVEPTDETAEDAGQTEEEEAFGGEEDMGDGFEDEFGEVSEHQVYDPLSGYNRFMTTVNDRLYFWILKPVATGYNYVMPEFARIGIDHFFDNLFIPFSFINNLMQLKFKYATTEFLRFGINSTIGILGLMDPAKAWFGLEEHTEDFGQTLGHYGVGSGIYIVLPVLGPSNLRDMFGLVPEYRYDPIALTKDTYTALGLAAFDKLNYVSLHLGEYENIKEDAVDFYPFLRDVYEQNRNQEIRE